MSAAVAERLPLVTLLGHYPGTRALRNGEIDSPLLDLQVADVKVSNRAFPRVVNTREFSVAEIALVTFFQARAYGRPLVLLPAVIGAGRHQHQCLVYNAERGRITPADLHGKRVAIRAHSQTTVTWVRGILASDYGVDLDRVHWITMEGAHLADYQDPPHIARADGSKAIADLLLDGEVDAAIIGTGMPDDARLQPVIDHPLQAARDWSARNGATSINHMVAIDSTLAQERPDVVRELWRLLLESKRRAGEVPVDGRDLTPFGVEPNRRSLALLLGFAWAQGLLPRPLTVDELFDDTTRALIA